MSSSPDGDAQGRRFRQALAETVLGDAGDLAGDSLDIAAHGFAFSVSENKPWGVLPCPGGGIQPGCGVGAAPVFHSAD